MTLAHPAKHDKPTPQLKQRFSYQRSAQVSQICESLTEKQTVEPRQRQTQGTLIKTLMKEYALSKAKD